VVIGKDGEDNFPKIRNGRVPDALRKHVPVKLSSHCKLIGTLAPYGGQISKQIIRNTEPYEIYRANVNKYGFDKYNKQIGIDPANLGGISYTGGWDTNKVNLYSMSQADSRPHFCREDVLRAIEVRGPIDLKLPFIDLLPSLDWLMSVVVKPNSFPGYLSSRLFGHTRKLVFKHTTPITIKIFDLICKKAYYDSSLYQVEPVKRHRILVQVNISLSRQG
jgi:hypothetical protein